MRTKVLTVWSSAYGEIPLPDDIPFHVMRSKVGLPDRRSKLGKLVNRYFLFIDRQAEQEWRCGAGKLSPAPSFTEWRRAA